jgi:hypothetical protein
MRKPWSISMFDAAEPCWDLIDRTRGRIGDHVAELRLGPDRGICVARTGGPRLGRDRPSRAGVCRRRFLVAQDADGSFVGETVYGSSVHAAA